MAENVPVLGKLCDENSRRDAIHLAIAPVVSGEQLRPGMHVGLREDGRASRMVEPIGIVDPFLDGYVEEGQTFWLCLYPNTVTSLRHVWTHEAFKIKIPGGG